MSKNTPSFGFLTDLDPHERPGVEEADYVRKTIDYNLFKFFGTDSHGTSGLVYAWHGGIFGGSEYPGGNETISPNSVNYFELDEDGVVISNNENFSDGTIPLAIVKNLRLCLGLTCVVKFGN